MADTDRPDPEPFVVTEEQDEYRAVVREFLESQWTLTGLLDDSKPSPEQDSALWWRITLELGLTSLLIPERYGGQGGSWSDLVVALEECGAGLLAAPYFATAAVAVPTLLAVDDEQAGADYLPGIADGTLRATLLTRAGDAATAPLRAAASADRTEDGWAVTGSALVGIDGGSAGLLLVAAEHAGETSVFGVDAEADGVNRRPLATLNLTRSQARVDLDNTPARLIGTPGDGTRVLTTVIDLAAVAQAAEQVGGAARCLHDAVEHTRQRFQFGRPIASFQAVKHTCADLLAELELGRSAVAYAAWAADHATARLAEAAAGARLWCSRMYRHVAEETLQLYGGLGATWEHPAHLYLRRANSAEALLSGARYHEAVLASAIRDRAAM